MWMKREEYVSKDRRQKLQNATVLYFLPTYGKEA